MNEHYLFVWKLNNYYLTPCLQFFMFNFKFVKTHNFLENDLSCFYVIFRNIFSAKSLFFCLMFPISYINLKISTNKKIVWKPSLFCWHVAIILIEWQSEKMTRVFVVINVVFKKHLKKEKLKNCILVNNTYVMKHTSRILKKAIPVRRESEPAWCCGPILLMSNCSATSCKPP